MDMIDEDPEPLSPKATTTPKDKTPYWDASYRKDALLTSVSKLLLDSQYSDFTILCGGYRFPVHKAVICPQSEFFAKAMNGSFFEAKSNEIVLPDDPLVVRMMLDYFYKSDYTFYMDYGFPSSKGIEGVDLPSDMIDRLDCCELSLHLKVILLAYRLLLTTFRNLATRKFFQVLYKASFSTVFPRAVKEAYAATTGHHRLIRRNIVTFAFRVLHGQCHRCDIGYNFPKHILDESPEFTRDLMERCIDSLVEKRRDRSATEA
ncbi:hypothetical protein ETB97_001360 [Aspergillus alliaceus]|uniref:BTB domain-containing protein n=1 Tax=Petromyces alliaceus TaxID=209559 RepID=A0A5N6FTP4_PETAA|nr:uncharacterized protein BDW43DRAFT_319667 [Aspergillus alliaceus]KAB8233406.1 hypothetical protein BDW43DRAFT_319667 [Aspergillus alliaceus]KAE8395150.1 hypothetical protein BDV23DRAFT_195373 [Aspergillus alliaceus]KAF5860586.1 hypothetical protein ETB97_001360 [Aspergillus burnettii]